MHIAPRTQLPEQRTPLRRIVRLPRRERELQGRSVIRGNQVNLG